VDSVQLTPGDDVLVKWYQSGPGRQSGVELYDRNMAFLRQLATATGHLDVTRDAGGDAVMVWLNAADPAAICPNGVVKVRLADGQQTCLLSLNWSLAAHVSAPDGTGWVIVSTYAPSDPGPLDGWAPYANEILQVKLDGSEVRRLAQHRSRPAGAYYFTPRAAVSRDGTRLVYSSNFGLPATAGAPALYADVYLIDLAAVAPAPAGSIEPIPTRVEQDAPSVAYGGIWLPNGLPVHSGGGAVLAMSPGARASLGFTGTGVGWLGYRDPWSGIARVSVDGGPPVTVDTSAPTGQPRAVLFARSGLAPGPHTLVVEVAGVPGATGAGAWVWVDAFDVVSRLEQDDPAVEYACLPSATWYSNDLGAHSGGRAALAMTPGCRATLHFTGTAASWIGYRDPWSGIAAVHVDGELRAELDTYGPADEAQARVFTVSGLPPGPHTLAIEPTGRAHPAAGGAWVWVDAFEVRP
jgi:hypothetical protein